MFNDLPPLTSLRAFEAAVRLGAFNLAAEELNVTPAAVGAQVRSLEAWLGYALFERRNRRVVPTRGALRLQQACHGGFSMIRDGVESSSAEAGSLTVGVGSLFASRWLSPRLSGFWMSHPDVSLRLVHSPVVRDSLPDGYDAAIVWGTGTWPNVSVRRILQPALLPVASPDYVDRHGCPTSPSDLAKHPLIQEKGFDLWRAWFEEVDCQVGGKVSGTTAGDGAVAMQLALDGQGICLGVKDFVEDDLRQGRLIALFDPVTVLQFAYYLVLRATYESHVAATQFVDWITAVSGDNLPNRS